jgi:hypothetical protein
VISEDEVLARLPDTMLMTPGERVMALKLFDRQASTLATVSTKCHFYREHSGCDARSAHALS